MSAHLKDDDRRAIDILLNHAAGQSRKHPRPPVPGFVTAGHVRPDRLDRAARLLATLDRLPPVEYPADLVSKTMSRIDNFTGSGGSASQIAPRLGDGNIDA